MYSYFIFESSETYLLWPLYKTHFTTCALCKWGSKGSRDSSVSWQWLKSILDSPSHCSRISPSALQSKESSWTWLRSNSFPTTFKISEDDFFSSISLHRSLAETNCLSRVLSKLFKKKQRKNVFVLRSVNQRPNTACLSQDIQENYLKMALLRIGNSSSIPDSSTWQSRMVRWVFKSALLAQTMAVEIALQSAALKYISSWLEKSSLYCSALKRDTVTFICSLVFCSTLAWMRLINSFWSTLNERHTVNELLCKLTEVLTHCGHRRSHGPYCKE